jgi:hypothetical protein
LEKYPQITPVKYESKASWPKGPGFGLPLKGAVLLKAV